MASKSKYLYADKKEQLKRANMFLIASEMMFFVFAMGIIIIAMMRGIRSVGYTAFMGAFCLIVGGVTLTMYIKDRGNTKIKNVFAVGFMPIMFVASYGFSSYYMCFLSVIPFVACILIFDEKFSRITSIVVIILQILVAVFKYTNGIIEGEEVVNHFCATFAVVFTMGMIYFVVSRASKFIRDMLGSIEEDKEEQRAMVEKVLEIASDIRKGTDSAMDKINILNESTAVVNGAVTDISDSTLATAENIQTQTVMTRNIQDAIQATLENSNEVVLFANELERMNHQSIGIMGELKEQSKVISDTNANVADAMRRLQERTNDVKSIADTIFAISSQTNLLALNASIESARAGEAGKSFAVVANEIRQLAEKTRKETENISNILQELNNDAELASNAVANSVDVTTKQDEMILKVSDSFDGVSMNVNKVAANIEKIDEMLSSLSDANNSIVDNIMHLSAATEEVTASSTQAAELSHNNLKNAEETKKQLTGVLELSYQLDKYSK